MTFLGGLKIYLKTNPVLLTYKLYDSAALGEMTQVTDCEQAHSPCQSEDRRNMAFLRRTDEQNAASLCVLHVQQSLDRDLFSVDALTAYGGVQSFSEWVF